MLSISQNWRKGNVFSQFVNHALSFFQVKLLFSRFLFEYICKNPVNSFRFGIYKYYFPGSLN